MFTGSTPDKETRKAVIIGINDYDELPKLNGAERDAKEILEILADPDLGNFHIPENHRLIGKDKAKFLDIRQAVSDLFWQTGPCDFALFYFSGHGCVDGHGNAFIAPSDMKKDEPYIHGIGMNELREMMIKAPLIKVALLILDCCYSGASEEQAKGPLKNPYQIPDKLPAEGRYIIASSQQDQESTEICIPHSMEEDRHYHGIFSYYLLEALRTKCDPEDGTITLDKITKYVGDEMSKQKRQRPQLGIPTSSDNMGQICLAFSAKIFRERLADLLSKTKADIKIRDPQTLIEDIVEIKDVLDRRSDEPEVAELKRSIIACLEEYNNYVKEYMRNYWYTHSKAIKNFELKSQISRFAYDMSYDKIKCLNEKDRELIVNLCSLSMNIVTKNNNEDIEKIWNSFFSYLTNSFGTISSPTSKTVQPIIAQPVTIQQTTVKLTPSSSLSPHQNERPSSPVLATSLHMGDSLDKKSN